MAAFSMASVDASSSDPASAASGHLPSGRAGPSAHRHGAVTPL
jgi:hypothetical protein